MAEIPSHIASSAAQAGFQSREVGRDRDAQRAGQAAIAQRQIKSVEEASDTVETTDSDTRVTSDSEGAGSQGRTSEQELPKDESSETQETPPGVTEDDDGHLHLDLEA